jgi:hypothetical protein
MTCSNGLLSPSDNDHAQTKSFATARFCLPAKHFAPLPYAVRG